MKIKAEVRTEKEIDQIVAGFGGTWVRRSNAYKKLKSWSNELIEKDIDLQRTVIRELRASGASEYDLSPHFAEITRLEMRLL